MEDIRLHVAKRGKRNVLSRSFHARDSEKAIETWQLDLDGIRRALEVRPFTGACVTALISCSQAELAVNADEDVHDVSNTGVPEVRPDVLNTHLVVSRTHHDGVYPRAWGDLTSGILTISATHRNTLESYEDANRQNRAVSAIIAPPLAE